MIRMAQEVGMEQAAHGEMQRELNQQRNRQVNFSREQWIS